VALKADEKNKVTGILGQAIQNGQNMLSELLGKAVTITVASVDSIDAGSIGGIFTGRNLVAPVELGDGMGTVAMIVPEGQAAIMADLMIGQDGTNPPAVLEDLHLSAVTELTNQIIDSVVSSVSSQVAKSMLTTPLEISVLDMDSSVVPGIDGDVIIAEGDLQIGDFSQGKIGFVFAGDSATALKKGPQAESSADGFVNDITGGGGKAMKTTANAQNVVASELQEEKRGVTVYDKSLDIVMDVPLQVTVELGRTEKLVRDVLEMSPGSVVELDKLAGEPVDILINQKYIAKGEVVVIDENFGIRITDIVRPAERIPKL
jgi:flagellar motor switch protein FliN/FliY